MLGSRPIIPAEDYLQRWQSVQTMMVQHELDLLVVYADGRAVFGSA